MKITVITVCRNSEDTLPDTMQSVLKQSYDDYEYIIIDGGSSDGTVELIRTHEKDFAGRMRWISEPDQGIYDAMNKGLRMTTGDIIGFLNADDYYQDNHVLQDIARAFCDHPEADAIHGDLDYINRERKVVRTWRGKEYAPGAFRKGWSPAHPTFYCKRQCFEQYGPFVPSIGSAADFELMLRFTERFGIRTRHLKRSMVFMRTGGSSTNGFKAIMRNTKQNRQAFLLNSLPCPLLYPVTRLWHKVFSVKNPFKYLSQ